MEGIAEENLFPIWLQELLTLTLTIAAAVMYAAILGTAVIRTIIENDPIFTEGAVRAASLLSGLVGSVVAAGFARGKRVAATPVRIRHPMGGKTRSAWTSLARPSLVTAKLAGLARALGLHIDQEWLTEPSKGDAEEGRENGEMPVEVPEPSQRAAPVVVWIALLYFTLYFIVGITTFILTVVRPFVPELVSNAAWVWLGTVVSAGYSFFALGPER